MKKNNILSQISRMKTKFTPRVPEGEKAKEVRGRVYSMTDAYALKITAEVVNGALVFTIKGRWISLNEIISKAAWISDVEVSKFIKKKVREAIKDIDLKIAKYEIWLRYNSKLDDHNTVMMPKYFTDALKKNYEKYSNGNYVYQPTTKEKILEFEGILIDDDKRYARGTHLVPDETLPHNTYVMTYEPVL